MPVKAQNQSHVFLMRDTLLSEAGAGPAAGDVGQVTQWSVTRPKQDSG